MMTVGYACRVGERLRLVRRQQKLSLQDVETTSDLEFRASVLGAYERGERAISVPRLARLARYYGVPVDALVPHDDAEVQALGEASGNGSGSLDPSADLVLDLRVAPGGQPGPVEAVEREADAEGAGPEGRTGRPGIPAHPAREVPDRRVTLDLGRLRETTAPGLEVELLRRWAAMLQRQRQDFNGRVLSIRADDVRTISLLLGTDPATMPARLGQLGLCVSPV